MHRFGEVQAHQTSSNILKLHPHRDSKVYRLLSHEFRVVRLDQTFSDYTFTGDTRCARNIVFFHMSAGWFDCTEPSLTTSRCLALYCMRVCTCTFCVLTLYNGIALPIKHANNFLLILNDTNNFAYTFSLSCCMICIVNLRACA